MNLTASRRTTQQLLFGIGIGVTLLIAFWMIIDQTATNSIQTHVDKLFIPLGHNPSARPLWNFLWVLVIGGLAGWSIALYGTLKQKKWVRLFSTIVFLLGFALLLFGFLVTEFDFPDIAELPLLPNRWRYTCLGIAIYGVVTMLVTWLPTGGKITE